MPGGARDGGQLHGRGASDVMRTSRYPTCSGRQRHCRHSHGPRRDAKSGTKPTWLRCCRWCVWVWFCIFPCRTAKGLRRHLDILEGITSSQDMGRCLPQMIHQQTRRPLKNLWYSDCTNVKRHDSSPPSNKPFQQKVLLVVYGISAVCQKNILVCMLVMLEKIHTLLAIYATFVVHGTFVVLPDLCIVFVVVRYQNVSSILCQHCVNCQHSVFYLFIAS